MKHKILVIDDEESVCASIEMVLGEDYDIFVYNNAKEAISVIEKNKDINLVLLDIKMPEMDGLTATEKIHNIRPDLKIMIITAGRLEELYEKATLLGVDDFINKPFEVEDLRDRVIKLLEQ